MMLLANRRQADDLQVLLDGGRPRSAQAADELRELVALASALRPAPHAPRAEFRAQLRERLVAEAPRPVPRTPPPEPAAQTRRSVSWRLRQVAATIAVASVVAGAGAAVASTRALPGDTLYGLKRQIENVQLSLAHGDLARGRELLEQSDARLSEAEALASAERGPQTDVRVGQALRDLDASFTAAAEDLTRAYRDTGDDEPLRVLDQFVVSHRERLTDLMQLLDPSLRDQARELADQLAVVGAELSALLGTTSTGLPAASAQPATGPDRAVDRELDLARRAATASGIGAAATTSGGAVGGVLDSLGGTAGAATGGGSTGSGGSSGSDGSSGGLIDDVTGSAGTTAGPGLPTVQLPLPEPTLTPTSVVTILPSDPVGQVTSAVPLTSACVPLPPLTSCP